MDLKFITKNNKIGIIFQEGGLSSNIFLLDKEEAGKMIKQAGLALLKENDLAGVFSGDNFSFIKQQNASFLLSIKVNEHFAIGYSLHYRKLKEIISQLKRLISKLN